MTENNTENRSNETGPASSDSDLKASEIDFSTPERIPASRNRHQAIRPTDEDDISLKELILKIQDWIRYLLSKWMIIFIVGLLGGGLGFLYSITKRPLYTASLIFVLEEEGKGNMGNLGGLAAMAGINLGGGGGGVFQGDNILELYKSRSVLTRALLSHAVNNDSLLVDRYISFNGLKEDWEEVPNLKELDFTIPREEFTLQHDSLLGEFINTIRKELLKVSKPDKMLSLIKVETISPDEGFSKDFTEVLVQNVNAFYVETKTKKALENLAIVQHQTDSVRQELNAAIGGVATSMDANPNANLARQVLKVSSLRREVDVQTNQAILNELVKNLEMAKISLRQETPLIQPIDEPVLPLKVEHTGKVKGVVLGGIIGGILIILLLASIRVYRDLMNA